MRYPDSYQRLIDLSWSGSARWDCLESPLGGYYRFDGARQGNIEEMVDEFLGRHGPNHVLLRFFHHPLVLDPGTFRLPTSRVHQGLVKGHGYVVDRREGMGQRGGQPRHSEVDRPEREDGCG